MTINIQHNGTIDIALGKNRKETSWRNKEILWSELVERLSETHRTAETHAEYVAAKKSRQDEIKDIGGFVGGYLTGGRRKPGNVLHRQLVTLDADFATQGMWDDFILQYGCAGLMYSTHKHTPEHPRFRVIIPLDRPVMPDEYIAISRKIAGNLGIECFDNTGFQPYRLMYWASTSKDGEYFFRYQDGEWLNADEVLGSYRNWRDSSEWPVSERYNKAVSSAMKKQGDPLEKPGVVGAFCRVYSIEEAIDIFLPDVYEQVANIEGRYSYKEGSTSGGVVVYDGKYAYSHHSTDPCSEKLCNAFDLVRLHKFGLKDEDVREGTPGNKLPSYLAMLDFAAKNPDVRRILITEKMQDAKGDFADEFTDEDIDDSDDSWKERLEVDRKGNTYSTIGNIALILENDTYFKGKIAYDDFEKCEVAVKDLPWRKVEWNTRRLTDRDDANIRHYLERAYGISNATKTQDAMQILCEKTKQHPVREYLENLRWDKIERLETLFIDYQGVNDSKYARAVTRKSLIAAVARIFQPGIKYDNILTLVGKQGIGKSMLLAKLGGKWFSDSFSFHQLSKNETKACEQIQGVWIVEIAELAGLTKVDIESVKQFIAKTDDRFRVAYGRRTENFPRQCVFFGTTNKFDFLRDVTGNRRYFPLFCTDNARKKAFDITPHEIDQIWAEAVELYRKGENLYLPKELVEEATKIQKHHTEEHPWQAIIQNYLDTRVPDGWNKMNIYDRRAYLSGEETLHKEGNILRTRVCLQQIWDEAIAKGRDTIDERSARIIKDCMMNIEGWERVKELKKYGGYGPQRNGYIRTEIPTKYTEMRVTNKGTNEVQNR
ncbi:MAG: hypothetical protein JSS64_07035 [Bacteroidetes bacterium]|nr:hypothetical protein [Bacteroidota bacterium]